MSAILASRRIKLSKEVSRPFCYFVAATATAEKGCDNCNRARFFEPMSMVEAHSLDKRTGLKLASMLAACCCHQHSQQARKLLIAAWLDRVSSEIKQRNFVNSVVYTIKFVAPLFNPHSCFTSVALLSPFTGLSYTVLVCPSIYGQQ